MREKKYRICMSVPLGTRTGTLILREEESCTNGEIHVNRELNVLNQIIAFSGALSDDGQLTLFGEIQTLMSKAEYTGNIRPRARSANEIY